jgi:hypothetical protein
MPVCLARHNHMSARRIHKRGAGNALIEASLTLGVFLTFLFTLYDFSWVLFLEQTLVEQARAAARYGAINPVSTSAIQNVALYGTPVSPGQGHSGILGLKRRNVGVTRTGQGTTADQITVTISGYEFTWITFGWAGTHTGQPITAATSVEN